VTKRERDSGSILFRFSRRRGCVMPITWTKDFVNPDQIVASILEMDYPVATTCFEPLPMELTLRCVLCGCSPI
jgi:hypothetical protein